MARSGFLKEILCNCLGKKSGGLLWVISYHHELVVELREESFDSFLLPSA